MGNSFTPRRPAIADDEMQVFVLYKTLGHETYVKDLTVSHHICLLKTNGGTLRGSSGSSLASSAKGLIKIKFGEHSFYPGTIYYRPVSMTRKTLAEIEAFSNASPFDNTDYSLLLKNCQHYVTSCIEFLEITDGTFYMDPFPAKEPQSLTLSPWESREFF